MGEPVRSRVVREIITTEDSYLHQLHTLHKYFVEPSLEKSLFPSHVHTTIFGELATLHHMNQELRRALGSGDQEDVGAAFLRLAPFLKAYSSYAKNYQQAINLLLEWEGRSRDVRMWLNGTECRPEVSAKLPALLITPVQRVPRYRLLLGQLLKHTLPSHPHYSNIAQAVEEVGAVAEHIDRSVSQAESLQRTLMIQRALKHGQPPIVAPGRSLLKEGMLHKMSRNGNNSLPRLFFLFTDVLLYTKLPYVNFVPTPSSKSGGEVLDGEYKSGSLECCCLLPLRHCSVLPIMGTGNLGLFRLKCEREDMVLYSAEESAGREWAAVLQEAVQQAVDKRKTLRKDSSSRRPMRRPALRKLTIKGDAENILPLKATNPRISDPSESEQPPPASPKSDKKPPCSPSSLMSQLLTAHDCLTPSRSWLSPGKKNKKAEQNANDETRKPKDHQDSSGETNKSKGHPSGEGKSPKNHLTLPRSWPSPSSKSPNNNNNKDEGKKRDPLLSTRFWLSPGKRTPKDKDSTSRGKRGRVNQQDSPELRKKGGSSKRARRPATCTPNTSQEWRPEINGGRPFSYTPRGSPCFKPSPLAH